MKKKQIEHRICQGEPFIKNNLYGSYRKNNIIQRKREVEGIYSEE